MARIVSCNDELFVLAKQHVTEHDPDSSRSVGKIRQRVTRMAQDA